MNLDALKEKGVEIAFSGDLDALGVFVSEHPDVMTHLLLQVCNRRPLDRAVIAFLIDAGVDVNGKKESGTVALHGVASFNDVESARLLLDAGAEVHVPGGGHFNDGTPLDFAMGFGFPKLVDLFVDHGAKIYNLELAAAAGRLDLVTDYFLPDGKLRARAAVKSLTEEVAEDAVLENAQPCIQRAFMMACVHGRVDVVRFLLQYDVDVNATIGFEYHGDEWAHLEKENQHQWISGSVLKHVLLRRFDDIAMLLCAKGAQQTPSQL